MANPELDTYTVCVATAVAVCVGIDVSVGVCDGIAVGVAVGVALVVAVGVGVAESVGFMRRKHDGQPVRDGTRPDACWPGPDGDKRTAATFAGKGQFPQPRMPK
jgi:hypothetical protein